MARIPPIHQPGRGAYPEEPRISESLERSRDLTKGVAKKVVMVREEADIKASEEPYGDASRTARAYRRAMGG